MTRGDIITRFRQENPEITANVASDAVLQSWVEVGNLEVATKARLIRGETTFSSIIDKRDYSLTSEIVNFYDIDELPGGGVVYDNRRIELESIAGLYQKHPAWLSQSSGIPRDYYRRNEYIYLGTLPSAIKDILVYTVDLPDTLDNDSKKPFNELAHLEPFHYVLVLYLKMRVFMGKVKKKEDAQFAKQEYDDYINWMKKETFRGTYQETQLRPPTNYRGTGRSRR